MKILLVTGSYPPMHCGVGDYAARLARALVAHAGAKVLVLTSKAGAPTQGETGIEVVPAISSWGRRAMGDYRSLIRRCKPDVVHIQFPTQGYDLVDGLLAMAVLCRFIYRIPVVVTLHEFLPATYSPTARYIYLLALAASRIIVVRPNFRDRMPAVAKGLFLAKKIDFIPNATAVPRASLSVSERAAAKFELDREGRRLILFFGFIFEHKGVDLLFEIADPAQHHLVIVGALVDGDVYHQRLRNLASSKPWCGHVTFTGFVELDEAAHLMEIADAVVLPYRDGGGIWNSSFHAALAQDSFVLTTSNERNGYDENMNVYYARPGDVHDLRSALIRYQDRRLTRSREGEAAWREIAGAHAESYRAVSRG